MNTKPEEKIARELHEGFNNGRFASKDHSFLHLGELCADCSCHLPREVGWEEEFDRAFPRSRALDGSICVVSGGEVLEKETTRRKEIKKFISRLLSLSAKKKRQHDHP